MICKYILSIALMATRISTVNAADRHLLALPDAVLGTVLNEWVDDNRNLAKLDIAYVNKKERLKLKEICKEHVAVQLRLKSQNLSRDQLLSIVKYIHENYMGIKSFSAYSSEKDVRDGDVNTLMQHVLSPERRYFPLEYFGCQQSIVDLSAVDLKKATKLNTVIIYPFYGVNSQIIDHQLSGINKLKSLRHLGLSGTDITGFIFTETGYVSLEALYVSQCKHLDFKNVFKWGLNLRKLTILDISFTDIADDALKFLLENSKEINTLMLAKCVNLTKNGFEHVGGVKLERLDVSRNPTITDSMAIGIKKRSSFLKRLYAYSCPLLTKASFQNIENLKYLSIGNCPLITEEDKKELADKHQELTVK